MPKSIAVAGKGGTGKSTLAALLVRRLCDREQGPVLAVDADPDANLGSLLGLPAKHSIGQLREDLLREVRELPAGLSKPSYVEAGLHHIIEEARGFDLMTMGRGEGAGCYCYLNSLIRQFTDQLAPSYAWIVIDNEAGLEHLSRRTTRNVDILLILVTDNPLSLDSARRIRTITEDLDNRIVRRCLVTNMLRPERAERIGADLRELTASGLEILCDLPYQEGLDNMVMEGKPLTWVDGSPLLHCLDKIITETGGQHGTA
jgi:CO dehydrogenase maturation factor